MSSATVCNCQHNTPDPEGLQAMSSRQSGQQQKAPDGRTCWAGSVVRRVGDCRPNADAGGKQRQKLVNSGSVRYRGAWLCWHRYMSTPSLYVTRSGTSSQWSSACVSRDKPWSNYCTEMQKCQCDKINVKFHVKRVGPGTSVGTWESLDAAGKQRLTVPDGVGAQFVPQFGETEDWKCFIISAKWTKWMAEIMRSFHVCLFVSVFVCAQRPVMGVKCQ